MFYIRPYRTVTLLLFSGAFFSSGIYLNAPEPPLVKILKLGLQSFNGILLFVIEKKKKAAFHTQSNFCKIQINSLLPNTESTIPDNTIKKKKAKKL